MSGRFATHANYQMRSSLHCRWPPQSVPDEVPFWPTDFLLGVAGSFFESEALCVREAHTLLHQRRGIVPVLLVCRL